MRGMNLRLPIDPQASGIRTEPPGLGQHSQDVLKEAGFTSTEIERLLIL